MNKRQKGKKIFENNMRYVMLNRLNVIIFHQTIDIDKTHYGKPLDWVCHREFCSFDI